jgi:hypothetical protein
MPGQRPVNGTWQAMYKVVLRFAQSASAVARGD